MLNIDYKYFASSKDPIEIINKYRRRGIGTICTPNKEIPRLIKYSNLVPKWQKLYNLNIKSNSSIRKILGQLPVTHSLFQFENEHCKTKYAIIKPTQCSSDIFDVLQHIYTKYQSNLPEFISMSKLTTICNFGYVKPVKKWIIHAFLDNDV
jgi:hypothetical protein